MPHLNIATGVFPGFNDKQGLMLCGYEWGDSGDDQESSAPQTLDCIFSNKARSYGEVANTWRYDLRIMKWFELFGCPLSREDLGGDFEKCILQTNWCDTQNPKMEDDPWVKLLESSQVDNFIYHIEKFQPRLIFFLGSPIIKILQHDTVLPRFMKTAGAITEPLKSVQQPFDGRKFHLGFQGFENCQTVGLPHPTGSVGLSDDYIEQFAPEIGKRLRDFKAFKHIR
jgi:hypothetical protein